MTINIFGSSTSQVLASENKQIRRDFGTLYGVELLSEMNTAYEAQVRRVGGLMQAYARRDPRAVRAVEAYMLGFEKLNDPSIHVASEGEQKQARAIQRVMNKVGNSRTIAAPMVAEFLHTMNDFPTLTLACVNRQFERLSQQGICEEDCLSDIFFNQGERDYCEKRGKIGLLPVEAPNGAGCPHDPSDNCNCALKYWQFGETTRGDFRTDFFRDAVKWSWDLGQCAQYGGWTDEIAAWILRIQMERKQSLRASVLGNKKGINGGIFDHLQYGNIIQSADGTCNPSINCVADAVYVLENWAKQWAYHRDKDGFLMCNRQLKLITPDWDLKCLFEKALEAEVTETAQIQAVDPATGLPVGDSCVKEVETTASTCIPDMDVCFSRKLRETMGDAGDGVFFIAPVAGSLTDRNAFEEATITGFGNTQLFQKVPMWQTLGGRTVQQLGNNYCWDQEVMAVNSFGAGAAYPEIVFASDGSNAACPTP